MEWYSSSKIRRLASKPPAYMVERISDLRYAADMSKTSPSNARTVIRQVITQLKDHLDNSDAYLKPLERAANVILDNPRAARDLIVLAVSAMEMAKAREDAKANDPWREFLNRNT